MANEIGPRVMQFDWHAISGSALTATTALAVFALVLAAFIFYRLNTLRRHHHTTAERLASALDQIDIGIVLLNSDTRAEFINRAFRNYFELPDEKADSKPPFIALMYHGRDVGTWEMPEDELNDFIAQRTELMRAGDQTPINIDLSNGQVLRFSCTALPDGGRMLSYTPVTDLVRHTDNPADAEHFRAMRRSRLDAVRELRAAE